MTSAERDATARRYRGGWSRALLAVGVVAILLCLAIANAVVRANWSEVEDGVLWVETPDGLVAEDVAPGSAADVAGIEPGDVLLAVGAGRSTDTPTSCASCMPVTSGPSSITPCCG